MIAQNFANKNQPSVEPIFSEKELPKIAKIKHLIFLGSPNLQRNGINARRSDESVPVGGGDNTPGKDCLLDFITYIRPGCSFKASINWNWVSTGCLLDFLKKSRFTQFLCTEAWNKPVHLIKTLEGKIQTREFNWTGLLIENIE